ncbi:MAG: hypothetical protein RBT11_19155 [Desulfobacterales bacterium]|jgi:hypothetical protein|nr:hypothetical protein [Desulfobacterales bacterium]
MDKEIIEKLIEAASEAEAAKLRVLTAANEDLVAAYISDRSAANLKNWQATEEALQRTIESLNAKYFSEQPVFPNIMAVVEYLQAEGYKIKKSKVYKDRDAGLIRVDPDGTITHSEASAYITRAGLEKLSDRAAGQVDMLHARKTKVEIERLEAQTEKAKFEIEKERGKYLLKTDVKTEFALKLGAVESIFRGLLRTKATDYISIAGGNPQKAGVFLDMIYADLDDVLNQMCALEEFGIDLSAGGVAA